MFMVYVFKPRNILTVIALLVLLSPLHAQPDLSVHRVRADNWPTVEVYYSLRCNGIFLPTHAQQFQVSEDGIPVQNFTRDCPDTTATGVGSVALVLDGSASTAGNLNQWIRSAASGFIQNMYAADQAAVLHYSTTATLFQQMTSDVTTLINAVNQLQAGGQSATWDALALGVQHVIATGQRPYRAVILVLDGFDNASSSNLNTTVQLARQHNIHIIPISVGGSVPAMDLDLMASQTGGEYYMTTTEAQLHQAFLDAYHFIADGFRECVLRYDASCADGVSHGVRLAVQGVCNGSDEDMRHYTAPPRTGTRDSLLFTLGSVQALAGRPFEVPLAMMTATSGTLHPFIMDIAFFNACMVFDSISIPAASPLSGRQIAAIPSGTRVQLRLDSAVRFTGPTPMLTLHFTAPPRQDPTNCPLTFTGFSSQAGCFDAQHRSAGVAVAVPPEPVITPSGIAYLCAGDSLTLSTSSGFDSYDWSTGSRDTSITVHAPGNYSVTVMDYAGRFGTSPVTVVQARPRPQPRLNHSGIITLCRGGSVVLRTTESYAQYTWSSGLGISAIDVSQPGSYYVRVTDAYGCTAYSDTVVVVISDPVVRLRLSSVPVFCEGDSVEIDAGEGFTNYRWSTGEGTRRIVARASGQYHVRVGNAFGCEARSDTVLITVRPRPVANIAGPAPARLCPGDTITLDGGTGFASWEWSTGSGGRFLRVSAPGTYGLRVFDGNGCASMPDSFAVTGIPRPQLGQQDTMALCEGGILRLDAGDGYDSYQWSNGASTRQITISDTGRYFVRVASGGCHLYSDTVLVLRRNFLPVITASGPLTFCEGDSVVLDGGDHVSWTWSTGARTRYLTVRAEGSYAVSVEDVHGCVGHAAPVDVHVRTNPAPMVRRIGNSSICEGDTVLLALEGDYADWEWSGGERTREIHVTRAGSYHVAVWDENGCQGSSVPEVITVHPLPSVPIITRDGDTLRADAAQAYQWMRDGVDIPGAVQQTLLVRESGAYSVRVYSEHGCTAVSAVLQVTITSLPHAARAFDLRVYPDPTPGLLHVAVEQPAPEAWELRVTNILGQELFQHRAAPALRTVLTVDLATQPPGLYILSVKASSWQEVRRVVKQ